MGRSRESPVFARFGTTSDETKFARVGQIHSKAAPLQALGNHASHQPTTLFDDYDITDLRPSPPSSSAPYGYNR
jgi:hypothetical protein